MPSSGATGTMAARRKDQGSDKDDAGGRMSRKVASTTEGAKAAKGAGPLLVPVHSGARPPWAGGVAPNAGARGQAGRSMGQP